jgi:hypothetical protein
MALAGAQAACGGGLISIARFAPEDEPDIRDFNARLAAGGETFQFPTRLSELAVPRDPHASLWTEMWVARDESTVRGGFLLKHERLLTPDGELEVGNYQLPLSEGIVDRRFATVGLSLTQRAMKELGPIYSLGMGSLSRPLPRLLGRLGWRIEEVPFFFRVVNGTAFAKNIRALQTSQTRRMLLTALRVSGAANLATRTWRLAARVAALRTNAGRSMRLVSVPSFDPRADQVLAATRSNYLAMLHRGSEALNIKFSPKDPRLHRLMVEVGGNTLGWVVLTINKLQNHKQFGDLQLGCIVDGLLEPRSVQPAITLAARRLSDLGADLLVSNQSHRAWQQALGKNLFIRGPSNFILGRSAQFVPHIPLHDLHMNRGDGDGPINL